MGDRAWAAITFARDLDPETDGAIYDALTANGYEEPQWSYVTELIEREPIPAFTQLYEEEQHLLVCENTEAAMDNLYAQGVDVPPFQVTQSAKYEFDGTTVTWIPGVGSCTNYETGDGSGFIPEHTLRQWCDEGNVTPARIRAYFNWHITDAWAELERAHREAVTPAP